MWNKLWRISKQYCKTSTPPPDNQQKIKDIQLDFEDYLPQQKNATAINPDRVDWKMLETLGLSKDKLEQDGELKKNTQLAENQPFADCHSCGRNHHPHRNSDERPPDDQVHNSHQRFSEQSP